VLLHFKGLSRRLSTKLSLVFRARGLKRSFMILLSTMEGEWTLSECYFLRKTVLRTKVYKTTKVRTNWTTETCLVYLLLPEMSRLVWEHSGPLHIDRLNGSVKPRGSHDCTKSIGNSCRFSHTMINCLQRCFLEVCKSCFASADK
jgi:hypothetical protein